MKIEDAIAQTLLKLDNAYAPYSCFKVASAVITKQSIYFGVNVENASYGLTMCAERVVLFHSKTEGVQKEDIEYLVLVTDKDELVYPCGACRQVMLELLNASTKVVIANKKEYKEIQVEDLIPFAFSQEDLK